MLLLTAGADLGYQIIKVANEKFITHSITLFRKSDAPGPPFGKSGFRL